MAMKLSPVALRMITTAPPCPMLNLRNWSAVYARVKIQHSMKVVQRTNGAVFVSSLMLIQIMSDMSVARPNVRSSPNFLLRRKIARSLRKPMAIYGQLDIGGISGPKGQPISLTAPADVFGWSWFQ